MRKTISVLALLVALTCSAFGGEMQNGVTSAPPQPTPAPSVQEPTVDGDIGTGTTPATTDGEIENGAVAAFMEVVLNLLALS